MTTEKQVKKKKRMFSGCIGLVILIFACAICSAALGLGGNTTDTLPTRMPRAEVPNELPPTPTKQGSGPGRTNMMNSNELDYGETMVLVSETYSTALYEFSELNELAADDLTILMNNEWIESTGTVLAVISATNEVVRSVDPPDRFRSAHAEFENAAVDLDTMIDYYIEGVDDLDIDLIMTAATYLNNANVHINNANAELDKILD